MDTRKYLNLMSKLLTMTESKLVRKEGAITETLHLGGDTTQPTHDELSRTGLGKLAIAMQPAFDTDAGGHSERGHESDIVSHPGTHNEDDAKFSGKTVVGESDSKKLKLVPVSENVSTTSCRNCGTKDGKIKGGFCGSECREAHHSEIASEMSCPGCGSQEKKWAAPMGNRMNAQCRDCGVLYSSEL